MTKTYPAEATEATTSFLAGDRTIHCIVELSQARSGTAVKFIWKTVQIDGSANEEIKTVDYITKGLEAIVHGNLTLPSDWPQGTYKVEIYLNNVLAKSVSYSVR
jgi:hypothetical protein